MAVPLCPYFGKCGGCSTQHLDYSLQTENKKKMLAAALHYTNESQRQAIMVFSGAPYHYRNRMDFLFHEQGIGLREKAKWNAIVDIEHCAIADEKINAILKELRVFFHSSDSPHAYDFFDIKKRTGTFRYCVARTAGKEAALSFVLNGNSSRITAAVEEIQTFAKHSTVENIVVTYVPAETDESTSSEYFVVKGREMLRETLMGKSFWYSVQGFFQNNKEMAETMHAYCHSVLKKYPTNNAQLLDIYGGVGTFGIINAVLFKTVAIVEGDKNCTAAAEKNILENGCTNIRMYSLDAKYLRKIAIQQPVFAIIDPPRSGMDIKTLQHLRELAPQVLLYVSCNTEQLGKDIKKLKEYTIKGAALFDFFPQTNHSESVVELVRAESSTISSSTISYTTTSSFT